MANAIALVVLLLISPAAYAVTHDVGGTPGWIASANYITWVSTQNFTVGDTLLFTYPASAHAVDEVGASEYQSCNTASPIASHNTGSTTITLNNASTRYFVCPFHCLSGQKVTIVTAAAGATSTPAGPTPAAGSTPAAGGTPPSTGHTPPSAAVASAGGHSLMVGLMSLVLMGLTMG